MVGLSQYRVTRDYHLEFADGVSTLQCPYEGHILLGEVLDWSDYVSVSLDEGAVVSKQS
jgi:hypothetical protein